MSQHQRYSPPIATAAPPPVTSPTMLAWWAAIPAALFLLCQAIFGWSVAQANASSPQYAVSYLAGGVLGGLIVSVLLAWVAYRVTDRSQLIGSIAFSLVLGSLVLHGFIRSLGVAQGKAAVKDIMEALRAKENLEYDDLQVCMTVFNNGLHGIEKPGEVDRRVAMLDQTIGINNEMLAAGDSAHDALAQRLDQERITGRQRDRVLGQFDKEYNWTVGRRIFMANGNLFAAMRNFYAFLRQNEPNWTYESQSNRVLFKQTGLLDEFHKLQQQVKEAAQEQSQLRSNLQR